MPQARLEWGGRVERDGDALPIAALEAPSPGAISTKLRPGPGRSPAEVSSHQQARIHRAMIEIVSERGYEATTVRELARAAGVSTRTFYQHYSDKEACFLRTQQILLHRALGWLSASDVGVQDWKVRVSLGADAITQGWARDSRSAHVALIDSHSVGPKALAQWRQASRSMRRNITNARIDTLGEKSLIHSD